MPAFSDNAPESVQCYNSCIHRIESKSCSRHHSAATVSARSHDTSRSVVSWACFKILQDAQNKSKDKARRGQACHQLAKQSCKILGDPEFVLTATRPEQQPFQLSRKWAANWQFVLTHFGARLSKRGDLPQPPVH